MRLSSAIASAWLAATLGAPAAVAAEAVSKPADEAAPASPASHTMPAQIRHRPKPSRSASPNERYVEQMVFGPVDRVNASDALDEMLDELAADVAILGATMVSPVLLDRVGVSENMNPDFARVLQARLVAALHRVAEVQVQKCYECDATTARVEQAEWVVSRGIVARTDLVAIAHQYQARVVMTAELTLHENPAALSLDVQMVRAADANIVFAEQYRFRAEDGLLYRTADRAQSREARLRDLEQRLADRPRYANTVTLGVTQVPSPDHPQGGIIASLVSYRLLETFGVEREWRFGASGAWLLNPTRLVALVPAVMFGRRVTPDSLYLPRCSVLGSVGYFVTVEVPQGLNGIRGAPQFALTGECTLVHRLALTAQVATVPVFRLTDGGYSVGGLIPSAGVSFSW